MPSQSQYTCLYLYYDTDNIYSVPDVLAEIAFTLR